MSETIFNLIATMRGGIPECCDFCGSKFTEANYATPEEGGEWTCIQCADKWEAEYQQKYSTGENND